MNGHDISFSHDSYWYSRKHLMSNLFGIKVLIMRFSHVRIAFSNL